jgi:hypothetical protein
MCILGDYPRRDDDRYLEMITNRYVGPSVALRLAFWSSLLHIDGKLPVAPPGKVSKAIERLDILHCSPDEPEQLAKLDFAAVTTTLRRLGSNATFLGKLRRGSQVHKYFTHARPGFDDWLISWKASSDGRLATTAR